MITSEHPGEERMAISNNISKLLGIRRENISEFARNINISYTTAHDLYHGKSKGITFDLMNRLCFYFGVGPCELFPYTPDPVEKDKK